VTHQCWHVRALLELGPASIRTISQRAGITHSAASQTVTQMSRHGIVHLRVGKDACERFAALTSAAEAMVPALRRQWAITNAAAQAFDQELSTALSQLLREAIEALENTPSVHA
jgi:DNA-binding MarR family transcriptional regulator